MHLSSAVVVTVLWLLAALAIRLAVVVDRRERDRLVPGPGEVIPPLDDGSRTVRTSVVVLAVVAVLSAAAVTLDRLDPVGYSQSELDEATDAVTGPLDLATPGSDVELDDDLPTVAAIERLLDDADYDLDQIDVLEVSRRGVDTNDRLFQLVSGPDAWSCVEVTAFERGDALVEGRAFSAELVARWC